MIGMTSKITDILQNLIKEKITEVELRTWSDDILTDAIIKYNQEVPKDKKKIATTIAIRERLRQQNLLKLEPSNEFK